MPHTHTQHKEGVVEHAGSVPWFKQLAFDLLFYTNSHTPLPSAPSFPPLPLPLSPLITSALSPLPAAAESLCSTLRESDTSLRRACGGRTTGHTHAHTQLERAHHHVVSSTQQHAHMAASAIHAGSSARSDVLLWRVRGHCTCLDTAAPCRVSGPLVLCLGIIERGLALPQGLGTPPVGVGFCSCGAVAQHHKNDQSTVPEESWIWW